ncbi:MAG: hypothetical protein K2W95_25300 [Candidatus Obscuribacterales bacterium]|nr:hypothetical protein [Candidatus Obscuribacterales bacterium]
MSKMSNRQTPMRGSHARPLIGVAGRELLKSAVHDDSVETTVARSKRSRPSMTIAADE